MFNKMGLAAKLGMGFGVVVIIAILLGSIAVVNMKGAQGTAGILVSENIPEVSVANNIERNALSMMYSLRAYIYSHDQKFLKEGMENLAKVEGYIKDAKDLGAKSENLKELKESAEKAEAAVNEYEHLLNETQKEIDRFEDQLKKLVPVGEKFLANCTEYAKSYRAQIDRGLVGGAKPEEIKQMVANVFAINNIYANGFSTRMSIWKAIAKQDTAIFDEGTKGMIDADKMLHELEKDTRDAEGKKYLSAANESVDAYIEGMKVLEDAFDKIAALGKTRGEAASKVLELAKGTALSAMEETSKDSTRMAGSLSQSSVVMVVGLLIGTLIAVFLAFIITLGITKPINRIIETLKNGADQTAAAAGQVSSASQQLSQGATEQASSLEETSSSLDEMNSMTRQNADSANTANKLSQEARSAAEDGNKAMGEMQKAMGAINESADKIAKIIKTIEEIAFQTNLLALNAAVEAARAGEHGKGFAVVAEEVRNLAKRSAEAARNTADLIQDSISKAKNGSEIATRAGESLGKIVDGAKKVADIISEISAASKEQAEGIGQVTNAVSQMDQVTQQNASSAEESAAAAEELSSQAESLQQTVQELQQVIGGAGSTQLTHTAKIAGPERRTPKIGTTVHQKPQHAQAPGKSATHKTSGPKVARPEEVIPLDDDEKLKEF